VYLTQLRQSIADLLPSGLPLIDGRRWSDRILVLCAILFSWAAGRTLIERFSVARDAVVKMYPSRKRPGRTYAGFMKALVERGQHLFSVLIEPLRGRLEQAAAPCWRMGGWLVFAADSSKLDCPMTPANEGEIGCASKAKSWPQMILATFVHLGSGLPWCWRLGKACSSERELVSQMLDDLPPRSLVVGDAGFIGCEFLKTVLAFGNHLLIRAGANVYLIEKLGYAVKEYDGIVYLWPKDMQKLGRTPLVLRRITLLDGRNRRMVLLTSVLEVEQLSDPLAKEIYSRRWGIELFYRTLKQTMDRGKMLSDCPTHAEVEAEWSMLGVLMLGMIMLEAKAPETAIDDQSIAQALRAVRDAMGGRIRAGRRKLKVVLREALRDRYVRCGTKKARHWPHRKNPKPPGEPQARTAEPEEVQLAQQLTCRRTAA